MRRIGTISDKALGQRFVDYLLTIGIVAHVDDTEAAELPLWVEDEDRLEEARSELDTFLLDPGAARYMHASTEADRTRKAERRSNAAFAQQVFDRKRITRRAAWTDVPVVRILALLCVGATLLGGLGAASEVAQWLSMTEYQFHEGQILFQTGFPEILQGQIWRLFTPVFLHASLWEGGFGILHLVFNLLWLLDLGGTLERLQGGRALLVKVVVMGVLSNLLQYAVSGPAFGGMSGVVFGLLGYSWIRGKQDVTSGLYVNPQVMFMMTFWFFLGFSGMIGPIANAAHGGGLAVGLFWGYVSANRYHFFKK